MSGLRRSTRAKRETGSDDPPAAKRQKTSSQDSQDLKGDLSLLVSGEFSDAVIICEGVEFKIHKAVVVPRSDFFRAALTGNFKEGETGCVTIKERTVEQVKRTLHYIYGRKFDKEDELTMADCIDLINLGDYFLVEGMDLHSSLLLWKRLSSFLETTARCIDGPPAVHGHTNNPYETVKAPKKSLNEAGFNVDFTAAVEAAYGADLPPVNPARRMLADFVWAARTVLLGDPVIEALNKKFPDFGSQIFTVMNEGPSSGFLPAWTSGAQGQVSDKGPSATCCAECCRPWRHGKYPVYIDPTSLQLQATRAFCQVCVDKKKSDKEWKPWPAHR